MNRYTWSIFTLLMLSLTLGWSAPSYAAPNDLHLHFLYNGRNRTDAADNKKRTEARQKMFQNLSTELGFSIVEPILAPAETLGIAGFDLGVEFSVADIPETKEHWRRVVEDERPDSSLLITRLRLRKGIGASLEVDGSVGFFADSNMVLGGVGLKWALNEGF